MNKHIYENELTEKQQIRANSIFEYIESYAKSNGFMPSLRNIQTGLGISSISQVDYYLKILEIGGKIKRRRRTARGISLVSEGKKNATK